MMKTNNWIPAVFNNFFDTEFVSRANATLPAKNIKETDTEYIVEMAAPGMQKEDFSVHLNADGNLVVKMEKKEENQSENQNARYLRREFRYSKFEQTLLLPADVKKEDISAKVEHGVLTLLLPKAVEEEVSRQIQIA